MYSLIPSGYAASGGESDPEEIENLEGLTKVQEGIIRELQKKPGGGPFNEGLVTAVSLGVVLLLVAAAFR
jgi:hypothetical protein